LVVQHSFSIVCQLCVAGDKILFISLYETMSGMEKCKRDEFLEVSHNIRTRRHKWNW